jgi:RNA polymerase sigma-70 factor (ECF subfamily)
MLCGPDFALTAMPHSLRLNLTAVPRGPRRVVALLPIAAGSRNAVGNSLQPGTLDGHAVAVGAVGLQFVQFDAPYLSRLQARDAGTEAHFVTYFSELIRLKLRSRLASKEAIEDARQETFLRVFALIRAEGGLRQPERLGALVNSVCNNVLREQYRSKSRRESPLDDEPQDEFESPEPSALSTLDREDLERQVRQVMSELGDRDRGLLRCVLMEDRDKGEICAEFGVTREHLRVLVHRAKQSFKTSYMRKLGVPKDLGA